MRWLGSPVGALSISEDPLRPRVNPARRRTADRPGAATRWPPVWKGFVAYQIDTALKPLIDLKSAEQLSGIARGVAFRLVENFGLLNRRDVAEDIRSLDQDARGALRRLGVRFGAFNIFVPALIKPAPAGLLTMLWALQNDAKDKPGFGEVVATLSAGRTSIALDESFEKDFYLARRVPHRRQAGGSCRHSRTSRRSDPSCTCVAAGPECFASRRCL